MALTFVYIFINGLFSNSLTDLYFLYKLLSITAGMRIQLSSHEGGTYPLCTFMLHFVLVECAAAVVQFIILKYYRFKWERWANLSQIFSGAFTETQSLTLNMQQWQE